MKVGPAANHSFGLYSAPLACSILSKMSIRIASIGLLFLPFAAPAQLLVVTNGVQTFSALTNTTVVMSNRCELRITDRAL